MIFPADVAFIPYPFTILARPHREITQQQTKRGIHMYDRKLTGRSAWYELSFKDAGTLVIRIHRLAMAYVCSESLERSRMVEEFTRKFGLTSFVPATKAAWGFAGVLRLVQTTDPDWLSFECSIPIQDFEKNGVAPRRQMFAVRCTLGCLFAFLHLFREETHSGRFQLMVVEGMMIEERPHGGSLWVTLTPAITEWIAKFPDGKSFPEVEKALRATYCHIFPDSSEVFGPREFRVHSRKPNRLYMTIPGNACDLSPDITLGEREDDVGYQLTPHNVDSGLDQMTFFMGLARLQDLVREAVAQ